MAADYVDATVGSLVTSIGHNSPQGLAVLKALTTPLFLKDSTGTPNGPPMTRPGCLSPTKLVETCLCDCKNGRRVGSITTRR